MLYLGHIGITIFIATMLYLPILFAVIGVLLPDVVDKGLYLLGIVPCTKYFGHTIFFVFIVGSLTYVITRRWKLVLAISVGCSLHLIEDAIYLHFLNNSSDFIPWFFPLLNYPNLSVCGPLEVEFINVFIITELIGALFLIFTLGFSSKIIYLRKNYGNY